MRSLETHRSSKRVIADVLLDPEEVSRVRVVFTKVENKSIWFGLLLLLFPVRLNTLHVDKKKLALVKDVGESKLLEKVSKTLAAWGRGDQ